MNPKIFSDKVFQFLTKEFPDFTNDVAYQTDDSFDCELKSPSGKFAMWIATYNSEFTFGLKSPIGETDIHTHVNCYEEEDFEDCLISLSRMIEEIKCNKVILYKNESNRFDWIEISMLSQIESKQHKTFEKIFWEDKIE
jgi:hypothetical protein